MDQTEINVTPDSLTEEQKNLEQPHDYVITIYHHSLLSIVVRFNPFKFHEEFQTNSISRNNQLAAMKIERCGCGGKMTLWCTAQSWRSWHVVNTSRQFSNHTSYFIFIICYELIVLFNFSAPVKFNGWKYVTTQMNFIWRVSQYCCRLYTYGVIFMPIVAHQVIHID